MKYDELYDIAETCADVIRGINTDVDESVDEAISVGEPDLAIESAVALAVSNKALLRKMPIAKLQELAHDPHYWEIGNFAEEIDAAVQ